MKYLQYYRKPRKQKKFIKFLESLINFLDKHSIGFLLAWFIVFLIRITFF